MPVPRYRPDEFVPSGWDSGTPERKARFVNSLLQLIADEFPEVPALTAVLNAIAAAL